MNLMDDIRGISGWGKRVTNAPVGPKDIKAVLGILARRPSSPIMPEDNHFEFDDVHYWGSRSALSWLVAEGFAKESGGGYLPTAKGLLAWEWYVSFAKRNGIPLPREVP